ncbi:hypothetical protein C0Z16_21510 [Paraburkholderia rhynchosiae]|uniref:Uncharacterized protein n=1 Tax=Paraburkholderia rhynchosiae TaxID=487049 RepID=A0ABX4V3B6_9BURK|nr:hypothetical protein C0Z16_21510 [Paraburkholderia rhynchosiae]
MDFEDGEYRFRRGAHHARAIRHHRLDVKAWPNDVRALLWGDTRYGSERRAWHRAHGSAGGDCTTRGRRRTSSSLTPLAQYTSCASQLLRRAALSADGSVSAISSQSAMARATESPPRQGERE